MPPDRNRLIRQIMQISLRTLTISCPNFRIYTISLNVYLRATVNKNLVTTRARDNLCEFKVLEPSGQRTCNHHLWALRGYISLMKAISVEDKFVFHATG